MDIYGRWRLIHSLGLDLRVEKVYMFGYTVLPHEESFIPHLPRIYLFTQICFRDSLKLFELPYLSQSEFHLP